jgi:GlpG protein
MRQIGTISDEAAAHALADYLLTQKIETRLIPEPAGWEIWVCDEDRLPQARAELAAFSANPRDHRFLNAGRQADEIRRTEVREDEAALKRQVAVAERLKLPQRSIQPMTTSLIALCILAAIFTHMGDDSARLTSRMFITPIVRDGQGATYFLPGLTAIRSGEVWRLITPIFLHFSLWHILGNMMWLYYLGNQIEASRGSFRVLGLVLVIGALSNLAEYYLGGLKLEDGHLTGQYNPNFGGMSGVVFGLFGYVWMKMRFEPELGMSMSQQAFTLSLFWLLFCLTGLAGSIANGAHVSGLAIGVAIGAAPTLFRHLSE